VTPLRIWLVGFGTVGRWLVTVLDLQRERLASRYDARVMVAASPTSKRFVYDEDGPDLASALAASGCVRRRSKSILAAERPS
jgi:homoserine dehydrogenase